MKLRIKLFIGLSLGLFAFLSSCNSGDELKTVEKVDIEKYAGTWYEIYRLPNRFEKNLSCVTANYTVLKNGKIQVINRGYKDKDNFKEITGKAWLPNPNTSSQLKVQFFWPFSGDYYIMKLGENYDYALVGSPTRDYLWILARSPHLNDSVIQSLKDYAKNDGFAVDKMEKIAHDCTSPSN